ncbi:MAG: hypothetical protein K0M45_03560 [Candidatus Paracaedibacteraceae bacterium]|nr:hypothetical protein [Candidatus Paracaedibacteraceae bacterium]
MKIIIHSFFAIYLLTGLHHSIAMEWPSSSSASHSFIPNSATKRPRPQAEKEILVPTERSPKKTKSESFDPFLPLNGGKLELLTTIEDHDNFFVDALSKAQQSILITTHALTSMDEEIFSLLQKKSSAGLKIWIFSAEIEEDIERDLKSLRIYPCLMPIHAKIIGIDNKLVALGSFNWLSKQYDNSIDPSIVIHNSQSAQKILQEFWQRKTDYKKLIEFDEEDEAGLERYTHQISRKFSINPKPLSISPLPFQIELLSTPDQHHQFLIECFKRAEKKIVIYSRFISKDAQFLYSLLEALNINAFIQRGGILEIICQRATVEERILKQALAVYKMISWISVNSLHSKALIVDDGKITTVGSYNWFSSAMDFGDDYALLETTLIFKGQGGSWLATGLQL